MNDSQLTELLNKMAKVPVPSCSSNLPQNVWREIRLQIDKSESTSIWDWLLNPWERPNFALSGLALALVIGLILGTVTTYPTQSGLARGALELQVFSENAPDLPATLLAKNP